MICEPKNVGGMIMKRSPGRIAIVILAILLLTPLFWYQFNDVASAATPSLKEKELELVGEGETYQLEILNKASGSTYKWSSSNTKVAKVSSKGLITTVNKGSANIKCKITDSKGGTKTLTCKLKVIIPSTQIRINNAKEVNGAHILNLGEQYNFNRDIFPSNSSDKTVWSIGGGDEGCIRIDNKDSGIVTATKVGKVILVATAAKTATDVAVKNSIVNDAIIIEVVGATATVKSAEIKDSTEIKVIFDSPIDKNTIIDANNKLLDNIEITLRKNLKGVLAKDPGALTASLSADLTTLTIRSVNMFDGEYGISFSSKIKTIQGVAIEDYYRRMTFIDTIPPAISETKLDSTGMENTVVFTEAIDFTNFQVSNAAVIPTAAYGSSADSSTLAILNNKLNYILSEDKKSVTINLSKIAAADLGKNFYVTFTGIKDLAGNIPVNYTLTAALYTDNDPKPQARPVLPILRTSYKTITVTFDRAIEYAGWATLSNGSTCQGVVDANDNKKVNYMLSDSDALLTGPQTVSIGYWNGYKVMASDKYAEQMHTFNNVNFSVDKSNPMLLTYEFDAVTNILTLTYNKEVTLAQNTGVFSSTLMTVTDEIRSGMNVTYTMLANTDKKVLKLQLGNMTLAGVYSFSLEQGFVLDGFRNMSLVRQLTISNTTSRELPGPYAIKQSDTNLSQIVLDFEYMLDIESAQTISNYSIPGVIITRVEVTKNTKDSGATVVLTVADGSITVTVARPISISGVKGYKGSFEPISAYQANIELKDNMKPYYISPPTFSKNDITIRLGFSEAIKGSLKAKVTQLGQYPIEYPCEVKVEGNSVFLTLQSMPPENTYLKIEIQENKITDLSGNQSSPMDTNLGVLVSYK